MSIVPAPQKSPTWPIIIGALLVGTAYGPLSTLTGISSDQLADQAFWRSVLADTIRSFAAASQFAIGLAAGALGIPIVARGIQRVRGEAE